MTDTAEERQSLGSLLRDLRGAMSLREVRRLTNISDPYLSQIEKGHRRPGPGS